MKEMAPKMRKVTRRPYTPISKPPPILPVPHPKNDVIVLIFLNYLHNLFCAVRIKIT
jgi:hypothetical protein